MVRRLVISHGAHARLARAADWLRERGPAARALVVGATVEAAAETCRAAAAEAAFGWERVTLGRLAAVLAGPGLEERGLSPLSTLGLEAVCARLVHELSGRGALGRFQPVARQPGLARALSASLQELRMADVRPAGDLGRILAAYEAELSRARLADRAEVFRAAALATALPSPVLLVDVPIHCALEERFVARWTGDVFATAAAGDDRSVERLSRALRVRPEPVDAEPRTGLERVQRRLFVAGSAPLEPAEDVVVLSAPGESRECIEIVRRIREEAEAGVPFDRMAVLLRSPGHYRALLEEAFTRAGIPAFAAQGTVRPDPAGRAFLALLACRAEGLSARRFAEYLSLGEVPDATPEGEPPRAPPAGELWVPPDAELAPAASEPPPDESMPGAPEDLDAPVVAGTLRAPGGWEKLLFDAAVIGGRERWERRLAGLKRRLEIEREALGPDEPLSLGVRRKLEDLAALRAYALPLLDALGSLPDQAPWGEWLDALAALASRSLRDPARLLSVLAELSPMAPVGPVGLDEVRLVLGRRFTELAYPPSGRRHGRVFVGSVQAARGLSFDVVFVPGLAEKIFPQKVAQDPLFRDAERAPFPELLRSGDRVASERLALRLAAGAARRKLVLSWPRIDVQQARARVPSFYGLEVLRAAEGELPGFTELMRRAEQAGAARIGWPAPDDPAQAVDAAEHDLALLDRAFRAGADESRGTGHYLLAANPHLARALRQRARRWRRRWTCSDGLVEPSAEAIAALQAHALDRRSYSPTALQNFAACPYKFVLHAVHRLSPREVPEAIDEIDPLTRGSFIHEVQFEILRELQDASLLPLDEKRLPEAAERLERVIERVAAKWEEELAPAIERVWKDTMASIGSDLREWLRREAAERRWQPWRFELSFGPVAPGQRDPHSTPDPVSLEEFLRLRGSIDLVERAEDGALRATDYKSGRQRAEEGVVIGGGAILQPALYALALEKLFPDARVEGGRLWYCTYAGDFESVEVRLDGRVRESVRAVAHTISDALSRGFLPAAPRERECEWCDYLPVCGPGEEVRVKLRKPSDALQPLVRLREMP